MNFATSTEQDALLTSPNGIQWLTENGSFDNQIVTGPSPQISVADPAEEWDARSESIGQLLHSVSIPNVSVHGSKPAESLGIVDRKLIAEEFAKASEIQLREIATRRPQSDHGQVPKPLTASPTRENLSQASSLARGHQSAVDVATTGLEMKSHSGQTHLPEPSPTPDMSGVVQSILMRTTSGQSATVMFVGSEDNPHVDSSAAATASAISKDRRGRVLLIDANPNQQLTRSSGLANRQGFGDVIQDTVAWQNLVCKGAASGVDFLGYGRKKFHHARYQTETRSLVSSLIQEYDYICISAGPSDSINAKIWSDICDGCYVLISQTNDNPVLAKSAVAELQASGAKLLGCVVTEAKE